MVFLSPHQPEISSQENDMTMRIFYHNYICNLVTGKQNSKLSNYELNVLSLFLGH